MSFEGYTRFLCTNGHQEQRDVYEDSPKECEVCMEPFVWQQTIDETNGSYCSNSDYVDDNIIPCKGCEYCDSGRIDGYFDLITVEEEIREPIPGQPNLVYTARHPRYLIPDLPNGYSSSQLEEYGKKEG